MRRILALVFCAITTFGFSQKPGHEITVTIKPFKNEQVNLYAYYGNQYMLKDSGVFNAKSTVVFKGKDKLPGGIYTIVIPNKHKLIDVLMDEEQHFSAVTDTNNLAVVKFTGSKDNNLYNEYTTKIAELSPEIQQAELALKDSVLKKDSVKLSAAIKEGYKKINEYRENLIKQHPDALIGIMLNAMRRPEERKDLKTKEDTLANYYHVKEEFWRDVNFSDDRLLYTPFFDAKVDEYFAKYVHPNPDSIIAEVKYMLISARGGEEIYKHLLLKFTSKYFKPQYMGQDKVFLYLFTDHYLKGDMDLLSEENKDKVTKQGYYIMSNQLDNPSPQLLVSDTLNKTKNLYDLNSKYTFLVFWDPTCGHCKEYLPKLDSIYKASWKQKGVTIFAVNLEWEHFDAWKKYINEHKLYDWMHVYQTEAEYKKTTAAKVPGLRQLFNVQTTPTVYLLDKDKRIIAKDIELDQYEEFIKTNN